MYTFYCWRPDGSTSPSFEARALSDDNRAMAAAERILADHASCTCVEVFEGDRRVGEFCHAG